jgi:hypothetical protein
MAECSQIDFELPGFSGRKIEGNFAGGNVSSERTEELASCSTLCRLENRAGRKEAWLMHQILFDQFVGASNRLLLN